VSKPVIQLGLRENWAQFSLLVVVNAFVGAMVGMERSILPAIAEDEFQLAARTAILSFIVVFGVTKALTNYFAGRWSDRFGRKRVLVAGWLVAAPVPFLLMWAPSWSWILAANVLLGVSQGLTWSTTVTMKIDLAGPKNRGLAMGLNEFAGYFAVALSALATGFIAAEVGLRPQPFYLGVGFVAFGTLLSVFAVEETLHHVGHESKLAGTAAHDTLSQREVIARTSFTDPDLSSVSQAGMVNNLNDGMAWGLFPLVFAAAAARDDAHRGDRRQYGLGPGAERSRPRLPARVRDAREDVRRQADRAAGDGRPRRHHPERAALEPRRLPERHASHGRGARLVPDGPVREARLHPRRLGDQTLGDGLSMNHPICLDHNATTPLLPDVVDAMLLG
jgi:MFS family permease